MVYLADEPALARVVALKILHPRHAGNRDVIAAFREEAVAASRVRHPSCVGIIECNRLADGTPIIVMEYVPGRPLGRVIAEEPVPLARAIELMTQILSALDTAHRCGVIHADIKSDNFLVETLDGGDHVTLIDFGLARLDGTTALNGMVSGTPEYMAPEVIRGQQPTPSSDLYGAGVILYELLTGTTPFAGGTTAEILARQLGDLVVPPSLRAPERELPLAIDHIVMRALAKEPTARYPEAADMLRALRVLLRTRSVRESRDLQRADASSADSPTRNCSPAMPRRFARGSSCQIGEIEQLRRAIGDALTRGDLEAIESGYAALAAALVRNHQFAAAVRELEEGIELLGPHGPTDELVVALAALYEDAGQRHRARHLAALADQRRTLAG